jgi:hypothetical protein
MLKAIDQALIDVPHLSTSAPASVQIRPYVHGKQTIVQMLNLDIDADKDEMHAAKVFRVSVPLPAGTTGLDGEVTLYAADGDQPTTTLPATVKAGQAEFEVPGLQIWSIVTFTGR